MVAGVPVVPMVPVVDEELAVAGPDEARMRTPLATVVARGVAVGAVVQVSRTPWTSAGRMTILKTGTTWSAAQAYPCRAAEGCAASSVSLRIRDRSPSTTRWGIQAAGTAPIQIGKRPHIPPSVTQWFGDSVGHWEGDTLVVDTTNFTNKTTYGGTTDEKLHMIERFKRLNDSDLQ